MANFIIYLVKLEIRIEIYDIDFELKLFRNKMRIGKPQTS